ncbi:Major facilitator superfamily MFS-1 domain containing protein [Aphelenchoides fujianensis]|nr:Major facilitator superfamily MFS-1 domain containing protein [Aphelenchoides fujianensis]
MSFGLYEFLLLILTQAGYLPVAAALLSTAFFEPSKEYCADLLVLEPGSTQDLYWLQFDKKLRGYVETRTNEKWSLLFEWDDVCRQSSTVVKMTTAVMFGAICGSFLAGFMADRYGRKPTVVGTLLMLALSNVALVLFAGRNPNFALTLFFVNGCCCGGYMVVNLVFVLEAVQKEKTRLLVASLNGWPIGMIFTALLGFACRRWNFYYAAVAASSLLVAGLLYSRSFESVGWLDNRNKRTKAEHVRQRIGAQNRKLEVVKTWSFHSVDGRFRPFGPKTPERLESNGNFLQVDPRLFTSSSLPLLPADLSRKVDGKPPSEEKPPASGVSITVGSTPSNSPPGSAASTPKSEQKFALPAASFDPPAPSVQRSKTQTYADLFRHAAVRRPLLALLYCFMTSSVVSFGFYFTTEVLPGNRYVNLAAMGALKFALGLLPAAVAFVCSKKTIILVSVGAAAVACWTLAVGGTWLGLENLVVTVLGVFVTASMDPTWKISHLYSVELFPTGVRNMARGVCNVTARLGSMAGPLVILLRSYSPVIPYWLFAVLLTVQWVVLAAFMPAAAVDRLPQEMPPKEEERSKA